MLKSDDVKSFAKKAGADLVGIAPIERFKDLPPDKSPLSMFPEAESVVVLGYRVTRGSIRGVEEGTNWTMYATEVPGNFLQISVYEIGAFLESKGWEAVPVYPYATGDYPEGVPVAPGKVAPNVTPSMEHAAAAAGLGEMGYCGVFLTPQFGTRQRFAMVITDAKLEPDPLFKGKICDLDMKCVEACPLDAISRTEKVKFKVAGKETDYGRVNFKRCRRCGNGARPNPINPRGEPDRLAAMCVRACMVYLEENGKAENKFHEPFRKREPWSTVD